MGRGVSSCVTCDGFFYKGQDVVIVGGGNTTAEEAIALSEIANTVTIIHRRNVMRADEYSVEKLKKKPNVKFEFNHVVDEILGDDSGVTGVRIKNVASNVTKEIKVSGVFIAIGRKPNAEIFAGQLDMDHNYIKTPRACRTETSISGVFVAGDVVFGSRKQAVVAAGSGCVAALDAKDYLASLEMVR